MNEAMQIKTSTDISLSHRLALAAINCMRKGIDNGVQWFEFRDGSRLEFWQVGYGPVLKAC